MAGDMRMISTKQMICRNAPYFPGPGQKVIRSYKGSEVTVAFDT